MAAFLRKGIAISTSHVGDLDQHQFFYIPGHRGLGYRIAAFLQLAGDNTILLVARSASEAPEVVRRLRELMR